MSQKNNTFLVISSQREYWHEILEDAISDLGNIWYKKNTELSSDYDIKLFDLVIINVKEFDDAIDITTRLLAKYPQTKIVVAIGIPTWRRTREIIKAGAADYLVTSFDKVKLYDQITNILKEG